jgi:L-fuculose-phosphate aldolase
MLEELRAAVCRIAKEADEGGLCRRRSGNFSARDGGLVAITPAGYDRKIMTPGDIIIIDMDGKVREASPGLRPTSETLMHLQIYRSRPDVLAVVHTHSIYATSFAVVARPIPAVVYECMLLNLKEGYIPVAPYARPGTPALAESVIPPLAIADAFLLERHGAVAVDTDLNEALLKAYYLEEMAQLYYQALVINGGKDPGGISAQELSSWRYPGQIG